MKTIYFVLLLSILLTACGSFKSVNQSQNLVETPVLVVPIVSATITVGSYGDLAKLKQTMPEKFARLIIPNANAQVQGSGVISVVYNNPGVSTFTLNTSSFMSGAFPSVSGDELNLGNISIQSLDDNTLRVCTGVGAPGNKCNRAYIRVFTLGQNISGSITNTPGFINVDASPVYGIDVLAGTITTPIGYNSNSMASSVTNSAQVFSYTIPNNLNRLRLTNTGPVSFPVKADLSNAGSGQYEMRLVIQYALGYVP